MSTRGGIVGWASTPKEVVVAVMDEEEEEEEEEEVSAVARGSFFLLGWPLVSFRFFGVL